MEGLEGLIYVFRLIGMKIFFILGEGSDLFYQLKEESTQIGDDNSIFLDLLLHLIVLTENSNFIIILKKIGFEEYQERINNWVTVFCRSIKGQPLILLLLFTNRLLCNQNRKSMNRLGRLQTKNSNQYELDVFCNDKWHQQYFPSASVNQQMQELLMQSDLKTLPEQYQKLVKIYQTENLDIQKKNEGLKETVRNLKQRESILLEEIAELQLKYKKLTKTENKVHSVEIYNKENSKERLNKDSEDSRNSSTNHRNYVNSLKMISSQVETYNPDIQRPYQNNAIGRQKEQEINQLNEQFYKLVQQSVVQKDPLKRKKIRKQLAQIAGQIKKMKNEYDQYGLEERRQHCSGQYGLQQRKDPYIQQRKKQQKQCQKQFPTNRTLEPYIQRSDGKKMSQTNYFSSNEKNYKEAHKRFSQTKRQ